MKRNLSFMLLVLTTVMILAVPMFTSFATVEAQTPTPSPVPTVYSMEEPPETPLCVDRTPITNDIVRAGGADFNIAGQIYCRTLVQNSQYLRWFHFFITGSANVGNEGLLARGITQMVDVFSPNLSYYEGGFVVCLRGAGEMVYLNAANSPRVAEVVGTYRVPEFTGYQCVTIFEPGTLALIRPAVN